MSHSRTLMLQTALLMLGILGITWGWTVSAQVSCQPYYIPSRLLIGSEGRVVMEGGANNVRAGAALDANKLGQLPPGSTFKVIGGPKCMNGNTWVQVNNGAGLIGWTVEIIEAEYALEPNITVPAPATFGPGSVDYQGVHFDLNPELATQVQASLELEEGVKALTLPPVLKFEFTATYPGQFAFMSLHIMSAQSFNNLYPTTIPRLSAFLANPTVGGVPDEMNHFASDGSLIRQHIKSIPFGSGQAYRGFATIWQDATSPSDFLLYNAHGLSSDGLYYIQASFTTYYNDLSIYTPPEGSRDDINAYIENFHAMINNTIDMAPDEAFQPRPGEIDALLASLTIAPGTLGQMISQADVVATHVAPTYEAMFAKQTEKAESSAATLMAQTATQMARAPMQTATQAALDVTRTALEDSRCGLLHTRLQVGQSALQMLDGSNTLRVRDSAGGAHIPKTFLYPGDIVKVLEGPVCVEEVNWWRVRSPEKGWIGWVAESQDDNYYLSYLSATATPRPPTAVPTDPPDYKCEYKAPDVIGSDVTALLEPRSNGTWQYYVFPGFIQKAIGRYKDETGDIWYLFSPKSTLSGMVSGAGSMHYRSFWGTTAGGNDCHLLPFVPPYIIERTYD